MQCCLRCSSGFSPEFAGKLDASGAGEYICELAYRRGGFVTFRSVPEMSEPLPAFPGGRFEQFRRVDGRRKHSQCHCCEPANPGAQFRRDYCFPTPSGACSALPICGLLIGLALQIGLTLENYVVMHDAQRRTKEYQLLTQIGQAISSRLDQARGAAHSAKRTRSDF